MQLPPIPADEAGRLRALRDYALLDTLPEQAYDDITQLASEICGTPTALVSLVDEDRQWFKSKVNFALEQTSRDTAFCAHAIADDDLFVVPDALQDERFADNVLVSGQTAVRFYAGAPLLTPEGHAVGTLCVLDQRPRELTQAQRISLRALARQVMAQFELRRHAQSLERRVGRTLRFQEALRGLARSKHPDLHTELQRIAQTDAQALRVSRVSLWMFNADHTKLTCPVLYHAGEGFQKVDTVLLAEQCPRYFRAMEESRVLAAADAETDPRTSEFTDWYLRPLGIVSMLDVPVWLGGKLVGLICHESVGQQRTWEDDEQDFAASVADMVSLAHETAERAAAEEALRQSEARFRTVFEQFPLSIQVFSPDGKTQQVNHAWNALFGPAATGLADFNPLDDPQLADVQEYIRRGFGGETVALPATPYKTRREGAGEAEGRAIDTRWIQAVICPVKDEVGQLLEVITVLQDVTEQRRAEESLRASEEHFKTLFEACRDPMMLAHFAQITDCNQAAADILGYQTKEDIFGLQPWDFSPERQEDGLLSRELVPPIIEKVYAEGYHRFEWLLQRADGTVFPAEISLTLIRVQGKEMIFTILLDITERRRAEAELRASEERFKTFFEACRDPVMLAVYDRVIDCNQATVELLGYGRKEEVISLHPWQFSPEYQDDGQPSSVKAPSMIGAAYEKGYHRFEWMHQRADGTVFPAEISLTLIDLKGEKVMFTILRDITERRRVENEVRTAYAELEGAREGLEQAVEERTAQLADTNGALRKEIAERRRTEEALRVAHAEAERANLAKSEFLSRMSHELRTPMNSILGFSQVLARKLTDGRDRKNVDHILHAGKHLLELINEVLDISRIEANRMQLSPEPVHLGRIVAEALAIIQPLAAQADCRLVDTVAECAQYVLADKQRLTQVLLNLLSNAVKYNRADGRVTLRCEPKGDDRLLLHIADTGRGIAPEAMGRLFNPFDRLGAESYGVEGTGLGLVLSKRLVEVMGGSLNVVSKPGQGSTFTVELLCAEDPQERLERGNREKILPDAPVPETSHTVLYVEDNVANLSLIETIFSERPGIVLRPALQGRLGIELAVEHQPDLILLDLHLPDMTGETVLRELKNDPRTQTIPVVVISADATAGQQERLCQAGALTYLTKPLDVDRLLEVVDRVLRD